jgi:hypothetical protein
MNVDQYLKQYLESGSIPPALEASLPDPSNRRTGTRQKSGQLKPLNANAIGLANDKAI